jgi:hypothetical protein
MNEELFELINQHWNDFNFCDIRVNILTYIMNSNHNDIYLKKIANIFGIKIIDSDGCKKFSIDNTLINKVIL